MKKAGFFGEFRYFRSFLRNLIGQVALFMRFFSQHSFLSDLTSQNQIFALKKYFFAIYYLTRSFLF